MTPLQRLILVLAIAAPLMPAEAPPAALAIAHYHLTPAQLQRIADLTKKAIAVRINRPEHNWGGGSCAWASTVNLLRWQGKHTQADWIRKNFSGGAGPEDIYPALDRAGIPWAEANPRGDERFLEWATRTRRGAGVVIMKGTHMVNLVGLDDEKAYLVGNNDGRYVFARPRAEFMQDWKSAGGWAFTIVGNPPPPQPWIIQKEGEKNEKL